MSELPDSGHQHEALHTVYVVMDTWENHVINSLYVQSDPDVVAACEAAQDAMMKAYQAIGRNDAISVTSPRPQAQP